ncbi:MAG: hypothetical protein M1608_09105, partial [Candidatus Omnitrophica bacterium]|nr:hypothetical protein [Candidatus Omnitrophota bacterium]
GGAWGGGGGGGGVFGGGGGGVGGGAWARLVFSSWQSCWVWHTLSGLGEGMITLTKAAMLFLEAAVPYWVIGIWAVVLVMNLYCLGLAAAFYRYVYKQIPARV